MSLAVALPVCLGWLGCCARVGLTLRHFRVTSFHGWLYIGRSVRYAKHHSERELEQQWVCTSVEGLISDIGITGVTTKGISLEVVLLERDEVDRTYARSTIGIAGLSSCCFM